MKFDQIIAFTDGACSGNPGPGGWGAVYVTPAGYVQELGGAFKNTTNNRMEMAAVCHLLQKLSKNDEPVALYTDSVYLIRGITEWIFGWKRRGWKNAAGEDVRNKDLWEWLDQLVSQRQAKIHWKFVKGHSGVPGNDRVDEIAVGFTTGKRVRLYEGPLTKYHVPIHDLPPDGPLPKTSSKSGEKKKAFSYLSVVDGIPQRHETWADCERRVKGRSGARFKKAVSADDEAAILSKWGIDPNF